MGYMTYKKIWEKILRPEEKIIKEFSLGRKYIFLIQCLIGLWGVLFIFIFIPFTLLTFVLAYLTGWYLRESNAYALSDKRILVHRGWLSTQLTSIDYDKITDIIVSEPFINRLFLDVGDLSINTAGSTGYEVILKNIEKPYEIKKKIDIIKEDFDKR